MRANGLALCGAALAALTALMLAMPHAVPGQFGIGYGVNLQRFVALAGVQGAIYFAAVRLLRRGDAGLPLILGIAILLRVEVLLFPPFLSNDIYRYVWDGWVQLAGINPYRYIPADPHLAFLRDGVVYPHINRATYAHTIYPPAAEMLFTAAAGMAKLLAVPPVFGMKLAMTLIEGGGIWAMLRLLDLAGLPRRRLLIYAWNPLPIWEFAGSGHVDAIAVGCIAFALLAACAGRSGLSAAALAGAVLAKFLPIVLAPALWRRWDWKFAAFLPGLIGLLYLPYLAVGAGVFGFLSGYTAQENIDSGQGIFLAALLHIPARSYLAALAAILVGIALFMVWRPAADAKTVAARAIVLGAVLLAGISPHYPWYYAFLLIPACLVPAKSVLYLTAASFLLYLNPTHTRLFWPGCVFGPFAALAVLDVWTARKSGVFT